MKVHLVDATFELFRAYYGSPEATSPSGTEVGATRGLMRSMAALCREPDVTHVACAFDHVVESFRNDMFDGYKTGEGVPEDLFSQFELAESAVRALGIVVWPMVEFEADDALATAVVRWSEEAGVEQTVICSPDKDLMQMVRGDEVVSLDRRRAITINEPGVWEKFGVGPRSIPDYLALVGDAADGIPGIPRWGAKSASTVLARYGRLEDIPSDPSDWDVKVRGASSMSAALEERRVEADLYKRLAILRTDVPLKESLKDLEWRGAVESDYKTLCSDLGFSRLASSPQKWL